MELKPSSAQLQKPKNKTTQPFRNCWSLSLGFLIPFLNIPLVISLPCSDPPYVWNSVSSPPKEAHLTPLLSDSHRLAKSNLLQPRKEPCCGPSIILGFESIIMPFPFHIYSISAIPTFTPDSRTTGSHHSYHLMLTNYWCWINNPKCYLHGAILWLKNLPWIVISCHKMLSLCTWLSVYLASFPHIIHMLSISYST